jgi:arylsulfatase A-like enzyme
VDQWRGDGLSLDGHPVIHTPYLDQLALGGVRFSRAYAAVPSCIAARASLMTGLTPRAHGRVGYQDGVAWNYETTLAGEFTRHGYQTQAIGKMHVHPARSQLGFQNVILHDGYLHFVRDRTRGLEAEDDYIHWLRREIGPDADYFDHGMNCNAYTARPWDKAEYLHPTNWIMQQGLDFFRRRDPRKPFFLYLSFHRPHPPLDPPAWAFEQYLGRDMPPPPVGDWAADFEPYYQPFRPDLLAGRLPPHLLQRARAGYYGHLTHLDHQMNRFFEGLKEWGVAENTWIGFVSDHGDLLGDHHLFRKCLPYEGSARVPLILKGPRDSGLPCGRVFDQAVELRDVMPTLLDCVGLPVPDSVEGRSLLPLLRGGPGPWRPHVHGEHVIYNQSVQWLTNGREKYVWFSGSGQEQLFDLGQDPRELHDLARVSGAEARLRPWRQALIAELAGREEGFTDGRSLLPGRPVRASLSHILA